MSVVGSTVLATGRRRVCPGRRDGPLSGSDAARAKEGMRENIMFPQKDKKEGIAPLRPTTVARPQVNIPDAGKIDTRFFEKGGR